MMDFINRLTNWFSINQMIGVDLGTSQVRITLPVRKKILSQPSIVAKNIRSDRIIAIGDDAQKLAGRTPDHIETINPILAGVVDDSSALEAFLSMLLYQRTKGITQFTGRNMVVALPAGVTDVDVRIVANTLQQTGARSISAVPASVAALVGVGAPVGDPTTQLVVNVGAGITQAGAVASGSVIAEASSTISGQQFDTVIANYIKEDFGIRISPYQARQVKHTLGAVKGWSDEPGETLALSGQDDASNLPREITLTRIDITEAIDPLVEDVTAFIEDFVASLSSDMVADITAHGIHLIGGGSKLPGLPEHISETLGIAVHGRVNPRQTVIEGVEYIIDRDDGNIFTQPIDSYESTA